MVCNAAAWLSGLTPEMCIRDRRTAFARMELSARAYHKILKLARTAADLSGDAQITRKHLLEVLQYRSLDRKYLL